MISDINTLNDTIEHLVKDVNCQFPAFSNKMDSETANKIFNQMVETLNALYEKTRLVEDLRLFAKQYIQNEFKKKEANFKQAAQLIVEAGEDYENSTKICHEIGFTQKTMQLTDRDGMGIPYADCTLADTILMANENLQSPQVESINTTSNELAYRRINNTCENYRSFYVLHIPNADGIIEDIQIIFRKPMTINYVDLQIFGCNLDNISLIRYDNQVLPLDSKVKGFKPQRIKGIQIKLACTAFDRLSVGIPVSTKTTEVNQAYLPKHLVESVFNEYLKGVRHV